MVLGLRLYVRLTVSLQSLYPVIAKQFPSGGSFKQLVHFGQMIKSGKFQKFNYGMSQPLEYDLSKVTVPVGIHYALGDKLVTAPDALKLKNALSNVILFHEISSKCFTHFDFVLAKDGDELLYQLVIQYLNHP